MSFVCSGYSSNFLKTLINGFVRARGEKKTKQCVMLCSRRPLLLLLRTSLTPLRSTHKQTPVIFFYSIFPIGYILASRFSSQYSGRSCRAFCVVQEYRKAETNLRRFRKITRNENRASFLRNRLKKMHF